MAQKRMFSLHVVDTDLFLDMPTSAQALYFHLAMRADDDGFVDSPRKIMKVCNSSDDDYKLLMAKRFVIPFDSGVCVIRHWRIHNYIKGDRYRATMYKIERAQLCDVHGVYEDADAWGQIGSNMGPERGQDGGEADPQYSIDKSSIDKVREEKSSELVKIGEHFRVTESQWQRFIADYYESDLRDLAERMNDWIDAKHDGKSPYKDYAAALRNWIKTGNVAQRMKETPSPIPGGRVLRGR